MADRLTWDFQALSYMQHILHTASNELMEQEAAMRLISSDASCDLNQSGTAGRRLADEANALTRKIGRIGEETEALERALRRITEMFGEAEDENQAKAEAVPDAPEDRIRAADRYFLNPALFQPTRPIVFSRNTIGWENAGQPGNQGFNPYTGNMPAAAGAYGAYGGY